MNTDILTLYAPQIIAVATGVAVILLGANILQAITAIVRNTDMADLEDMIEAVRQQAVDERAKREQADTLNEQLMKDVDRLESEYIKAENEKNRWQKVAKEVEANRDELKADRDHLYRRNTKGHFEAVVPQKPKPHTLKHGMTVKDPTPQQAKRIFREAKRAWMDWDTADNMEGMSPTSDIIFWSYGWSGEKSGCVVNRPESYPPVTYISAREFIRRIRGEQI